MGMGWHKFWVGPVILSLSTNIIIFYIKMKYELANLNDWR
jgi:hypothetical protein